MKKIVFCAAVAGALSVFAAGKGVDEKGEYYEDASGVKHYYLFQKAYSGNRWSINNNVYSRSDVNKADAATVNFVSGSIFAFAKEGAGNYAIKKFETSPVTTFYGMEFETLNSESAPHVILFLGASAKYTIGEYGIHSVSGNTLQFQRGSEGEEIHLAASQTWSGPAADSLSSAPFVIVPNYAYNSDHKGYVTAEDDVVLTIEGDTVLAWLVYNQPLTNMDMVVKSPARIAIQGGYFGVGNLHVRKLTIDGGCGVKFGADLSFIPKTASDPNTSGGATKYGIGSYAEISPVKVAQTIVLTNGAALTAVDSTSISGAVTVVAAAAQNVSVVGSYTLKDSQAVFRIEEGATLDMTGATFAGDGTYSLEGTGTVKLGSQSAQRAVFGNFKGTVDATAERLFVTDEKVTGEVSVASGETLLIIGDGLGADASLVLENGATVMFQRTAKLSASITAPGEAKFKTFDHSVTGTVAGIYETTLETSAPILSLTSPGLLVLEGGGTLGKIHMNSGSVDVTGQYDVYGGQTFYGGHMIVRDGGMITVKNEWQYLNLDKNTKRDACLEIASGGTFKRSVNNCYTYIGAASGYEAKLLISGGEFVHKYDDFNLYGDGTIEVAAGKFSCGRRFALKSSASHDKTKIVLKDGIWDVLPGQYLTTMFDGSGSCTVMIDGNARMHFPWRQQLPDIPDEGTAKAVWKCTPGSRLALDASDGSANATVTLHNFEADGLVFDLNASGPESKAVSLHIVNPKDPLAIGWVLPGMKNGVIAASGSSPSILSTYVVPEGVMFNTAELPAGWHSGFVSESISNLVFESSSTLRFPFFGGAEALSIAGTLTLPEAMNYYVDAEAPRKATDSTPVIVPAQGIAGGECTFACSGGVLSGAGTLADEDDVLTFSYSVKGMTIIAR